MRQCFISRISRQETKRRGIFHFFIFKKSIRMKKIVKQVASIDVAQDELVVCLGRMHDDLTPELYSSKTFANSTKGFVSFVEWVKKLTDATVPVRFVMEATGVYHEPLAYYLDEHELEISIVLPNKISNYARSLDVKTVTDKT